MFTIGINLPGFGQFSRSQWSQNLPITRAAVLKALERRQQLERSKSEPGSIFNRWQKSIEPVF